MTCRLAGCDKLFCVRKFLGRYADSYILQGTGDDEEGFYACASADKSELGYIDQCAEVYQYQTEGKEVPQAVETVW